MKITYYGHSCFGVETSDGKHLLFDPFISHNALATSVEMAAIKADYVLLSHGHFDHVADAVAIAKQNDATIIAAWEVGDWAQKQGIEKIHRMNAGGKFAFDFGTVKCVTAVHSSTMPDGTSGGAAMGFVVTDNADVTFYFAGDTALTLDMQLIPMICPALDFAILPVGDNLTMSYDDAIVAANFIQCDNIIAAHFDTFDTIKIDHEKVEKSFEAEGKTIIIPTIGQVIELD